MIEKIRLIVANQLEVPLQSVAADMKFSNSAMDSLEFVELMQAVEAAFWLIPEDRWAFIDSALDIERELGACQC